MLARIEQFADVMRDSKLQIQKVNVPLALALVLLSHETAAVCVYFMSKSEKHAWSICMTAQHVRQECCL